jgi:Immunoglobulin I-set domain
MKGTDEALPNGVEDVNGTLFFSNVDLDHRGVYTCFATNEKSTINASIEVKLMPRFEVAPKDNIETVEMQSILLDCIAAGFPKPTIKWDYEGKIINFENDERFQLFENGSLLLNEVRQDDSGEYACIIGNSAGLKRAKSNIVVKLMDSHSSFEDSEGEDPFIFSRAVILVN